jgi:hypothetical protein
MDAGDGRGIEAPRKCVCGLAPAPSEGLFFVWARRSQSVVSAIHGVQNKIRKLEQVNIIRLIATRKLRVGNRQYDLPTNLPMQPLPTTNTRDAILIGSFVQVRVEIVTTKEKNQ